MKQAFWLILIAVIFGVARFFMPSHPVSPAGSYQAFAHLFVGGLIGAWLASGNKWYGLLALALSVLEVVAFISLQQQ